MRSWVNDLSEPGFEELVADWIGLLDSTANKMPGLSLTLDRNQCEALGGILQRLWRQRAAPVRRAEEE